MKIELCRGVLRWAAREELATRWHITPDEIESVVVGDLAYRDGRTWTYADFLAVWPKEEFLDCSNPSIAPEDLLVHEVDLVYDPEQSITGPLTWAEMVAHRIYRANWRFGRLLESPTSQNKPMSQWGLLIDPIEYFLLQQAVFDLDRPDQNYIQKTVDDWGPECRPNGEPTPGDLNALALHRTGGIAEVGEGMLVTASGAAVVIDADGSVLDWFGIGGMLVIYSDDRYVAFLSNIGGYVIRDIVECRWVQGPLPSSCPRYVGHVDGRRKLPIVLDVVDQSAYYLDPGARQQVSRQSTVTSACGRFVVSDGADWVLEAETGRPMVDIRRWGSGSDILAMARCGDDWRFVIIPAGDAEDVTSVWLIDGRGVLIREVGDFNFENIALSSDGKRLFKASLTALTVEDADTGLQVRPGWDLRLLWDSVREPTTETPLFGQWATVVGIAGWPSFDSEKHLAALKEIWMPPDLARLLLREIQTRSVYTRLRPLDQQPTDGWFATGDLGANKDIDNGGEKT